MTKIIIIMQHLTCHVSVIRMTNRRRNLTVGVFHKTKLYLLYFSCLRLIAFGCKTSMYVISRFVVQVKPTKTDKLPDVWTALLDRMPSTSLLMYGRVMARVATRFVTAYAVC